MPFSQRSGFLLFNTAHVFGISAESRLGFWPSHREKEKMKKKKKKPGLPRCQRGHAWSGSRGSGSSESERRKERGQLSVENVCGRWSLSLRRSPAQDGLPYFISPGGNIKLKVDLLWKRDRNTERGSVDGVEGGKKK